MSTPANMIVDRGDESAPEFEPVPDWTPRPWPPATSMQGRYCRVDPLDPDRHAADLFDAKSRDEVGRNWTYLPYGPFASFEDYQRWMLATCTSADPFFHSVIDGETGRATGVASLMRIVPDMGVIEVGHIHFSPLLQRKPAATEAIFLLMKRVFDELGYRRFEWKCDALNKGSRAAARRFGFQFEGTFRQAAVVKGRNRDTAWFSILDKEWPAVRHAFETWLDPANFTVDGVQIQALSTLTREVGLGREPV